MRGYSYRVVSALRSGDAGKPWVALGLKCVDRDIPVDTIAQALNVSRQSVYAWFLGRSTPSAESEERITALLRSLD